ncbi:hypothetical protein [Mesorhizobium sp. B2-8-9]|uniref:hypothetical protein n=1 Tax=Mesorhizobium sp. B2-8-9 TaxID=2589899 RepID=UPI001129A811|nr:hypothetical protein [Mesorhizobium sp. B2-8-9]TPI86383.1 hypothetical protein FJ423_00740 [Mesorhizobium sp. B2-8-9]
MSITRIGSERWLCCDECGDDQDGQYENGDFTEMVGDAKNAGWLIRKNGRDYEHFCPTCRDSARPVEQKKSSGWSHGLKKRQFG